MKNNKRKRKICVFSGKRGGFGAFVPLMQLIEKDPKLELQVLLGDMHSSKEFGNTAEEAGNFFPNVKIEIIKMGAGRGDTPFVRTENLGECLRKTPLILKKLKPDFVLVHADRGEHLMVAFAALNLGIPIAHTQGGDISGNIDDIQRHAITKLAHIHFPENKNAAKRIERMGEEKWRIHTVGSLYIDRIVKKMYTPSSAIKKKYNLGKKEKFFITIFHPDTFLKKGENYKQMRNILKAIKFFGLRSFVIYPCSDPGYREIIKAIKETKNNPQFIAYKNIPNLDFLGLMNEAQALIGNSSCALVESPYLKLPAINIGNRQLGRFREKNVVEAKPDTKSIISKIKFVLTNSCFQKKLKKCGFHLGKGHASEKILKILKNIKIDKNLLQKRITY